MTNVGTYTERNYLGALLHLPAPAVRAVLADVPEDAFSDTRLRLVHRLVDELVRRDVRPDPGTVHAHAARTGAVPVTNLPGLAALLAELLTSVPLPTSVKTYGRAVVEDWCRRRITEHAPRLIQAAESNDISDLADVLAATMRDLGSALVTLTSTDLAGQVAA